MNVVFGKVINNKKFGNATVSIETSPLLFKDVFTFGVQVSKFDKKKYTAALCLDDKQLEKLEELSEECLKNLIARDDVEVTEVKNGLYTDKLYVKADPNLFTAYLETDEEVDFKSLLKMSKFNVNAAVDVSSAFIKDGVAHLQLYLHEIVILDEEKKEEKKVKRERVTF